jgi:hypothetical protein
MEMKKYKYKKGDKVRCWWDHPQLPIPKVVNEPCVVVKLNRKKWDFDFYGTESYNLKSLRTGNIFYNMTINSHNSIIEDF